MNKWVRLFRYDWPLHFILLLTNWLPDNVVLMNFRGALCRPFFKDCGKGLCLGRNLVFYNPSSISLGEHVYIAFNCWLCAGLSIHIGNKVSIGPGCVMASGRHLMHDGNFHDAVSMEQEEIQIGEGSWLGANVNVAGGTHIGKGSIVAAGCSVKGSYPDYVLIGTALGVVKKHLN